jgi:hypothetical protein
MRQSSASATIYARTRLQADRWGTCDGELATHPPRLCLARKAKVELGGYRPQVITLENYAAQLAEYSGEAPAKRAKEEAEREAAFAVDLKRICACGHPFTEHRTRDAKTADRGAYGTWGARPDCYACRYGSRECYAFRQVEAIAETPTKVEAVTVSAKTAKARKAQATSSTAATAA